MDNFFPNSASNKKNRKILYGPSTTTWSVPSGTTEVDVHVWGGGGGGFRCKCTTAVGGGGGGYARAKYTVTDVDSLSITVGGDAGTSSISIPTQSPGSPLSATGGTSGTSSNYQSPGGNAGGSGSVSLHPTFPTYYCMTASGGAGVNTELVPSSCSKESGGSAGSPKGNGNDGLVGGGGGIGGQGFTQGGWPSNCPSMQFGPSPIGGDGGNFDSIAEGNYPRKYLCQPGSYASNCEDRNHEQSILQACQIGNRNCCRVSNVITYSATSDSCGSYKNYYWDYKISSDRTDDWFYVEDIGGAGGVYNADAGPGGGGGSASRAGFLGGAGSGVACQGSYDCQQASGSTCGLGGCAGGSAARTHCPNCCNQAISTPGTPGVVIIYW